MTVYLFGEEWTLLDPWFLLGIPLVWALYVWRVRRPRAALPAASAVLWAGLPRTLRSRLVWLPPALIALALSVLCVALARPVTRDVVPLRAEGLDILLVLDVSSSMDEQDMKKGSSKRRVEAAREQALAFAKARTNDRVGLLTFARYADLRCPPTLDMEALAAFCRSVDTVARGSDEDMTALGTAIATATEVMREVEAPTKLVVFLTDGQDTVFRADPEAAIDPREAAKLAADAGVRVHTIGLGYAGRNVFGQLVELDFGDVEHIADTTGGKFYRARSADDLGDVYAEIDKLETRELEDPRYRTRDWFEGPLLAGALLFLLALVAEMAWIRGQP